jgi:hypothetical protein
MIAIITILPREAVAGAVEGGNLVFTAAPED